MNFKEIIGPDELDWKVIPLDWKKIGKEELKIGTPMSKDGVEANDASCYGILMDDVQKDKHFQARVIVSGCVDFTKAEEYSGIKISAEAKKAIGKVWSQGGGGLTELPEGYPYKEQSEKVLFEKQTLTFQDFAGFGASKTTAIPVELGKEYIVSFDGKTYRCTTFMMAGITGDEFPAVGNTGALGGEDTGEPFLIGFANNGTEVYSFAAGETHELQISVMTETIHTMAPEFLPAGVGGGGMVFEITESDYTNETSTYTVTKSYDPIYEQLEKGGSVVIKLHDATGIVFIVPQMSMVLAGQGFAIIARGMQSNMTLVFATGSYH